MLTLSSSINIFLFDSSSFLDAQNLRLIFQKNRIERILLPIAPNLLESLQESISSLPEIYATVLTTLQNHLNSLCPGQVVNVQTQLTPSSGSSQMGSEQEHSHDDLASFDQGNRGNEAREE